MTLTINAVRVLSGRRPRLRAPLAGLTEGGAPGDWRAIDRSGRPDLRPLAGLLTFAMIIPMAMFVGIHFDRLFGQEADIRRLAILYGGILLAVIAGMGWLSAMTSSLKLRHFAALAIPFLPFLSLIVMQNETVWLSALVAGAAAQFAVDHFSRGEDDGVIGGGVANLFRYIRMILAALLGVSFLALLATGWMG